MDMEYYSALIFLTCMMAFVMILLVTGNSRLHKNEKKSFAYVFLLLFLAALAEWLTVKLDGSDNKWRAIHGIVKVVELMIPPFIAFHLLRVFRGWQVARRVLPVCGVNFVLEVMSVFTGFIFYFDETNTYCHGPYYWLYMLVYVYSIGIVIYEGGRFSREYQNSNLVSLLSILVFVVFGISIHVFHSAIRTDWICLTINGGLLYIYYISLAEQMDSLTQLLDRKSYDSYISSLRKRAVILQCDIDFFKSINDTYGHDCGDECLRMVADAMKESYRKYGLCYRIGGDEFCVIITRNLGEVEKANAFFEELLEKGKKERPELHFTGVSVGSSLFQPSKERMADAIKRADAMMYERKKARREQAFKK